MLKLNTSTRFFMIAVVITVIGILKCNTIYAQQVDVRKCPYEYKRNNGNGQSVTIFASNISPGSIYYQKALNTGNQGNFTFRWDKNIYYPPVINKTWISNGPGQTTQNWVFGNNATGSPFNPPGEPQGNEVKYTFYNFNLPPANTMSFEFADPFNGAIICTCSYNLGGGSGSLVNQAVVPPSGFAYDNATPTSNFGSKGKSSSPVINSGGGTCSYSLSNHPKGVEVDQNSGQITWDADIAPATYNFSVIANNGIQPNATANISLKIHSIPVVDNITGNTIVAPDSTTTLENETPDGVWSCNNPQIAIVNNQGIVKGLSLGSTQINYKVTNIYGSTTKSTSITVTDVGVGSGFGGGLESKSLGNALSERIFNNAINSKSGKMEYETAEVLENENQQKRGVITLRDFMPDKQVLGAGFNGYISTPVDIVSFTNAQEVIAVDYVAGGINRAVALATKTYQGIYTHTKPVCDRLKGSELLSVDAIQSGEFRYLLYHLKPSVGLEEYAVSFSVGFSKNDDRFTLQSEWMTSDYFSQDTMYNFQLWSSDQKILNTLITNVISKLRRVMPIDQAGVVKKPVTFITKAERDPQNQLLLKLTVKNETSSNKGNIIIAGKSNEQSDKNYTQNFKVSMEPNATSVFRVKLEDIAEAEIRFFVNGMPEDFIYSNDGIWNLYATPASKVTEFKISNDTVQTQKNEYRLFRNVKVIASTSDYFTVYRLLKGGGAPANLTAYNFLKFNASGNGKIRIRLIKKSISNFSHQYEYLLPVTPDNREYIVDLSEFKSTASAATIKMNDIMIASFSFEVESPSSTVEARLSNVRFDENNAAGVLGAKNILTYPNPTEQQFTLLFDSENTEQMDLDIIHAGSGTVIQTKVVQAQKGANSVNVDFSNEKTPGMYLLDLHSANQRFTSKIFIK